MTSVIAVVEITDSILLLDTLENRVINSIHHPAPREAVLMC
jgi:hypothetical protein